MPHDGADCDAYASQAPVAPPLQHPCGHVVESHAQAPLVVSQRPFAHVAHAAPAAPHWPADCDAYGTHTPPAPQQPPGHELASHAHAPVVVLQAWPDGHAAQLAPPLPHEALDSAAYGSHTPPDVQQPSGQEAGLHAHCPVVVLHCSPAGHAAHVAPAAPHEALDSLASGSHLPSLQHPTHAVPPQVHSPSAHDCPEAHAPQAAPPAPHTLDDCDAYARHVSPLQQPVGHDVASQTHCPVVVLQLWPVAQGAHVAPAAPHDAVDSLASASHAPALQQPSGQVFASHAHVPLVVSHRPSAHDEHAAPVAPHWLADSDE